MVNKSRCLTETLRQRKKKLDRTMSCVERVRECESARVRVTAERRAGRKNVREGSSRQAG